MLFIILINYLIRTGKWKHLQQSALYRRKNLINFVLGRKNLIIILCFIYPTVAVSAGGINKTSKSNFFPTPTGIENQLFYLQRDPDANTVIYKLNIKNGIVDDKNPVDIFWIRYAEDGKIKPLSAIQRKLAYGVKSRMIAKDKHELKLVSYPDFPLYLMKNYRDNQYRVYANINNQQIILDQVFVRIDGGSFYIPNVIYIELRGKNPSTGENISHRIFI